MDGECVVVKVKEGLLKGRRTKAVTGSDYVSFQGVPFAQPPLGNLRFKDPQPLEPWEGVKDALEEGGPSVGIDILNPSLILGTEDCLYINIFTPEVPNDDHETKYPVMFFIHGGGFVTCNGNNQYCGPDFLVSQGIVMVSVNYRLGVLGFLSTEDEVCPGNWGLKDQQAALRWVNDNISSFGGDPNNVTIFGISAGGASVQYHMISPLSKGLFHRGISQSGVSLNPWALTTTAREKAFRLGELLGKRTEDSRELIDFLRTVDPVEMAKRTKEAASDDDKKRVLDFMFVPCVEPDIEGAFLPGHPIDLIVNDKTHDVPLIIGGTSLEGLGLYSLTPMFGDPDKFNDYLENFISHLTPELRLESQEDKTVMAGEVLKYYFSDVSTPFEKLSGLIDFLGDHYNFEGISAVIRTLAASTQRKAPIYKYCFSSEYTATLFPIVRPEGFKGASHGADMTMLFHTTVCTHNLDPESNEAKMRNVMTRLWTNFAKFGNPTPAEDDVITVRWEPYTKDNPAHLEIDLPLKMEKDAFKERMDFWHKRLPPCNNFH